MKEVDNRTKFTSFVWNEERVYLQNQQCQYIVVFDNCFHIHKDGPWDPSHKNSVEFSCRYFRIKYFYSHLHPSWTWPFFIFPTSSLAILQVRKWEKCPLAACYLEAASLLDVCVHLFLLRAVHPFFWMHWLHVAIDLVYQARSSLTLQKSERGSSRYY